ncbi:hypothetical protein T265_03974 [Opisthorchis viverrini]|uniref:Uncharacterized protein n=1 Tax=Opisthorchis viverrini TaxID=6198 RepID=A0A074ZQJ7_OPIVI|nr:hypothetical protein T265_03974 [Opisthorchis viverrini]KER29406.1 hypothetical protein T265_03974 [Opisthorchis viverrini]
MILNTNHVYNWTNPTAFGRKVARDQPETICAELCGAARKPIEPMQPTGRACGGLLKVGSGPEHDGAAQRPLSMLKCYPSVSKCRACGGLLKVVSRPEHDGAAQRPLAMLKCYPSRVVIIDLRKRPFTGTPTRANGMEFFNQQNKNNKTRSFQASKLIGNAEMVEVTSLSNIKDSKTTEHPSKFQSVPSKVVGRYPVVDVAHRALFNHFSHDSVGVLTSSLRTWSVRHKGSAQLHYTRRSQEIQRCLPWQLTSEPGQSTEVRRYHPHLLESLGRCTQHMRPKDLLDRTWRAQWVQTSELSHLLTFLSVPYIPLEQCVQLWDQSHQHPRVSGIQNPKTPALYGCPYGW